MSPTPRRRAILRLLAATLALPLAALLLGLWEERRGAADQAEAEARLVALTEIVGALEAQAPRDGGLDMTMRFRRNGQTFVGPLALSQAREALGEAQTATLIENARRLLPPVVVACAGAAAALSAMALLAGLLLGWIGRASRDALVRGFSLMRRTLPLVLAALVTLAAVAVVSAVAFEAAALAQRGPLAGGAIKLMGLAAIAILGCLWIAGSAVLQLRRALAAFQPDPQPIFGRAVSPAEAPGLWRIVEGLAERLGALRPDHVVVGLTEGFFVSSGAKILEPDGGALSGRTLYLPLPYLPLLAADEVVSIIGHELAHFSGGDTEYSLRFLPIYAGVGRSLDAVAMAGSGSLLLSPALELGVFVMDRFHHAVRRWSRRREFAADAAGAGLASASAAARALLRTSAIRPRIAETLDAAALRPDSAPADLVAATLSRAIAIGLDDPVAHLGEEQPHPTDTHPPTRERIAALDEPLSPALLAAAVAVPPLEALARLEAYFVAPAALCHAATADFLAAARRSEAAYHEDLTAAAAAIGDEDLELREGTRAGAVALAVFGGVFALVALVLALVRLPGLGPDDMRLLSGVALLAGLAMGAAGLFQLWRGERAFMTLGAASLAAPGLDRPIAWDHVEEMGLAFHERRVTTRLQLLPEAPFPERAKGGRRVKLDRKRRLVTLTAVLPRRMKPQQFVDLVTRYRHAAEARGLLRRRGLDGADGPRPRGGPDAPPG